MVTAPLLSVPHRSGPPPPQRREGGGPALVSAEFLPHLHRRSRPKRRPAPHRGATPLPPTLVAADVPTPDAEPPQSTPVPSVDQSNPFPPQTAARFPDGRRTRRGSFIAFQARWFGCRASITVAWCCGIAPAEGGRRGRRRYQFQPKACNGLHPARACVIGRIGQRSLRNKPARHPPPPLLLLTLAQSRKRSR